MDASEPEDTRTPERLVIDQIVSEVMAQLDDLSDDTMSLVEDDDGMLLAMAESLRTTLRDTLDQCVETWCAEYEVDA